MKTLTNQLRALPIAPEFEDTTTAKLFLDLASRADALEAENTKLRAELASAIEAKEYWMRQR